MIDGKSMQDIAMLVALGMAFAPHIRKEMFRRDRGVCQCGDCIGYKLFGEPLSFSLGFNMNCSHFADKHKPYEDLDINNGRLTSALEHCLEEIKRGNHRGVALLYEKQTFMNTHWLKEHDWHDIKPPLQMLYDCVQVDDNTPIVEYFAERLNTPQ